MTSAGEDMEDPHGWWCSGDAIWHKVKGPQTIRNRTNIQSRHSTSGHFPKQNRNVNLKR